jgi:membrane protein DedA with SNARE-associated domain
VIHELIDPLLNSIRNTVASWGYLGIVAMMAIESANIPLPSEAIMPTGGILVQQGKMNFHLTALAGAIGCLLGSIPSYLLGLYGGRPFFQKYSKLLLMHPKDLETADRWVDKYGDFTFLVCRMLPVVRTFISFPAGLLKAHFGIFCTFTFLGSLAWCYFLTYIGMKFGENMQLFVGIWHKFDLAIILLIAAGFGYYLYHHLKKE